jgi:Phosphotransferase enzyme family
LNCAVDEPTRERYADLLWAQPDWLLSARAWIEQHARIAGEIEQIHLVPWSTVLRVPTVEGDLFFKAASISGTFEPALTLLLAERVPERIAEPVAVELERGWMLTHDAGTRLRELVHSAADLHHWATLLPAYAELQIELSPEVDRLFALGVPDRRLARIPELLADLLEDTDALMVGLPDGLTSEELARMRKELPEIAKMCAELAGLGIPETLQHDDFHDGNVFVRNGRHVFFDWGDSCVSHPFHTLVVTLRSVAARLDLEPGGADLFGLRDAYLEPFALFGEPAALREAFDLAYRVGTIGRALAWYEYVRESDPRYRSEVADSVPYGLQRFLEHGPIGSWRWD